MPAELGEQGRSSFFDERIENGLVAKLDVLDARIAELGNDREHCAWCRDLRRYGTVPHAGFGLGLERTLAYVTGLANV